MKIAFTSCMDATRVGDQIVWDQIASLKPDVLLLLGDQIYMDWGDLFDSNWAQAFKADEDDALKVFATDMYSRYAAQWSVKSFRDLVISLRGGQKQVLLTWDDHDFAWNNAVGVDSPELGKDWDKPVPLQAKAVAKRLFLHFREVVRTRSVAEYPTLEEALGVQKPHKLDHEERGIDGPAVFLDEAERIECLMLDTRWYRSVRNHGSNEILGRDQNVVLQEAIARGQELLIVAAGSPLKHRHLLSEQDWTDENPALNYAEYKDFVRNAQRPILYLSGDIHRVAWGGRVRDGAPILEMLASPAAIGNIGPKKFQPSFGFVTVLPEAGDRGAVTADLWTNDGNWKERYQRAFRYEQGNWVGQNLQGESAQEDSYLADGDKLDPSPISALMCLARQKGGPIRVPVPDLPLLNQFFKTKAPFDAQHPPKSLPADAVQVSVDKSIEDKPHVVVAPVVDEKAPGDRAAATAKLMKDAFDRARASNKKSVVLFIHGLGKLPAAAIDQAYTLRDKYGECEPVLFCWPSAGNDRSGLLAKYFALFDAKRSAMACVEAVHTAVKAFALAKRESDAAGGKVLAVVVARSGGASLLYEALGSGTDAGSVGDTNLVQSYTAHNDQLKGIDRIVLSAPAIEVSDFRRYSAFFRSNIPPTVITTNANDQTLKLGRFFTKIGPALGIGLPEEKHRPPRASFVDFTSSMGVGPLHDYLTLHINDSQRAVNESLLYDAVFPGNEARRHMEEKDGRFIVMSKGTE
jgi:esterase/lipase superfamily enzyme